VKIQHFFDDQTFSLSYIVWDEETHRAIVIDPVLDYDQASSTISKNSIKEIILFLKENKLTVHYTLETHAHADHLSSAQEIKQAFSEAVLGIGQHITKVQETFKDIFNLDKNFPTDGGQFDKLFEDNETFSLDSLNIRVIPTPGHTPACCSYLINNAVFTGDTLFMPDYGTGRCDFPQGSSADLYDSITKNLYTLDDTVKVYTAHDYMPNGRELKFQSTIGEQKRTNIQLNGKTKKEEFLEFRNKRDSGLKAPKLLLPSIQVNINGGHLPRPENNQISYFKIPLKVQEVNNE